MSLIDEVEKLRELEQHAHPSPWSILSQCFGDCIVDKNNIWTAPTTTDKNAQLLITLRNLAPAMLDILGGFRKGDALRLFTAKEELIKGFVKNRELIETLRRFEQMAALMEKEEQ